MQPTSGDAFVAAVTGPKGDAGDVSTAQLNAAIAALKNGVVAAGDTLAELYALILLRAPIDGAALTNATTTTQAPGNNSTKLSTTAFVHQELINYALPAAALDTDASLTANSDSRVASQKAIKSYIAAYIATIDAMAYKGVIDCSANPNYPAADAGFTYRISVAGKIGGASGTNVEVGDMLICITDGSAAGTQAAVGANWDIIQANLDGAVIGPASVVSGAAPIFSGTSGKLIASSKVTITAPATSAVLTIPDGVTLTGPAASGTAMTLGNVETITGAKTFGSAGAVGKFKLAGTTSGSTTVDASAVASGVLTLPAATDTLVGKATADTFTNKTFDSAGAGNVLKVSGVTVSSGQYPGTTTNDNAVAGNVGQYFETSSGANNSSATVTMTIAGPCVVTWTGHGLAVDANGMKATTAIKFTTTGALPTGITSGTTYYARAIDANNFNIATTADNALAGTFITTTGSQSGVQTGDIRINMASPAQQNVAAVSLPAGDYDVGGQMLKGAAASTTVTFIAGNLSLVSGAVDRTFGRRLSFQYSVNTFVPGASEFTVFDFAPARFLLSAQTTIYLVADDTFGTSTLTSSGWIRLRRAR